MVCEVLGGGAEAECMKCDQISNTFTVVAICTFASDFSGTSDSKWDEVRHVFFSARRRVLPASLGSLLSRKRQLMKKTLKRRPEERK